MKIISHHGRTYYIGFCSKFQGFVFAIDFDKPTHGFKQVVFEFKFLFFIFWKVWESNQKYGVPKSRNKWKTPMY